MSNRSDILNSDKVMLASPNEASVIYQLGVSNPRPKGLFFIRFRRTATTNSSTWKDTIGFVAKSVDQPTISPQVEELNQYGRKRIIHTGVKYNPISVSFYDTIDGLASSLWYEYAQYYFGDFNHSTASDWKDDITASTVTGSGSNGFGFIARPTTSETNGLNTQFFFEAIEIFKVYGNKFIQTDLINPKITSFESDPLDYEDMSPLMVRMQLTPEAVIYRNNGALQDISSDAALANVFQNQLSGQVFDASKGVSLYTPPAPTARLANDTSSGQVGGLLDSIVRDLRSGSSFGSALGTNLKQTLVQQSGLSNTLGRFGNFSFGAVIGDLLATPATSANHPIATDSLAQVDFHFPSRDTQNSGALFDTASLTSSIFGKPTDDFTSDPGDDAMGFANSFSDGTVQMGKQTVSDFPSILDI
jgi:hypothetical protein